MPRSYAIRQANPGDAPLLAAMRVRMFVDMGSGLEGEFTSQLDSYAAWIRQGYAEGSLEAWIVEYGESAVGCAVLWIKRRHPDGRTGGTAVPYVLNVYVSPDHRRAGLARRMMEAIVAHCRERGFHAVELHASDEGRPLYESMGFAATNEMRLVL